MSFYKRRNPGRTQSGLSLIEMLLVLGITSAAFLTITASFFQGARIFSRLSELNSGQDALFFIDRMTRDLKNTVNYSRIELHSTADSVTFGAIPAGNPSALPVKIEYRWDLNKKRIERSEWLYPYVGEAHSRQPVLERVDFFELACSWPEKFVGFRFRSNGKDYEKRVLIPSRVVH